MAKTTLNYVCNICSAVATKWSGRCASCGNWDSLVEQLNSSKRSAIKTAQLSPQKINTSLNINTNQRLITAIEEVDKVLGGGLVEGSLTLLAGDPGIGKSTLVLQVVALLSQQHSILYVSGEESVSQIQLRANRLKDKPKNVELINTNDIDSVLAHVSSNKYSLVVIDSIQTMASFNLEGVSGGVAQITSITNSIAVCAKTNNVAFLIIGHVTKEGNLAGPRVLEHLVDTVLYLEGENNSGFKLLKSVKNRFGSTMEVGIFEMSDSGLVPIKNPSAQLLAQRQQLPGSIIFAAMEGSRSLLVEVQSLVSDSVFGYPKRAASGVDINRLSLLAAVATKRGGLRLSDKDIYVNIVGGFKIIEPAVDLAIILAIATSLYNISPPKNLMAFGEVGLSGELRSVRHAKNRVVEGKRLGFDNIIAPRMNSTKNQGFIDIKSTIDYLKKIN